MTPAVDNRILFQRTVSTILFKIIRLLFTVVQRIIWEINGTARKLRESRDPQNYGRCVQVLDVIYGYKFCDILNSSERDFLCVHSHFDSPQYVIDNDHISLMTIDDQKAVFSEAPQKGMHVWRAEYHSFMHAAQYKFSKRLLIVPLPAFHRMAETIGDPKAQIIFLFNTARCGSTLLTQIMEHTGRCVALSEPGASGLIIFRYHKSGITPELRQLARDVLRWEFRPYPSLQPQPLAYMLKFTSAGTSALPLFRELYPTSKFLFMYRDMLTVAKSLYRAQYGSPAIMTSFKLCKLSSLITEQMLITHGLTGSQCRFRAKHDLTLPLILAAVGFSSYSKLWPQNRDMRAISYEELVSRPLVACRAILEFCGLPATLTELAVKGLEVDSQRNSVLAKSVIGACKEPQVTEQDKASLNDILRRLGLPLIGQDIIIEGRLMC
jgi:hypothetical protein